MDAVDSVLNQTYSPVEIKVLNAGSDDFETLRVLGSFEHNQVPVVNMPRLPVSAVRNRGIKTAKGTLICCLDADDRLKPDYVSQCVDRFLSDSSEQLGIVCSYVEKFGEESGICHFDDACVYDMAVANQLHSASMFRRTVWERVGGYDESMAGYEDWEFWLSIVSQGYQWAVIPDALIEYRIRADSKVHRSNANRNELVEYMREKHASFFQAHALKIAHQYDRYLLHEKQRIRDAEHKIQFLTDSLIRRQERVEALEKDLRRNDCEHFLFGFVRYRLLSLYGSDGIRSLCIYGAGIHTRWILPILEELYVPLPIVIVDADPKRQGMKIGAFKVQSPQSELVTYADAIVLSSDTQQKAMRKEISALGLKNKIIDLYERLPAFIPVSKHVPRFAEEIAVPAYDTEIQNVDMALINTLAQQEMQHQMRLVCEILFGRHDSIELPDDNAEPSNPVYFRSGYYQTMLKRYLFAAAMFCRGKCVLETCCGRGWGASIIAERAKSLTALDRDDASLSYAKKRWACDNKISWVSGDCLDPSNYPKATYDVVLVMESIEHFDAQEQQHYLACCAGALKKGGILLGTTVLLEEDDKRDHPTFHMPGHKHIARVGEMRYWLGNLFESYHLVNGWMFLAKK